MAVLVHLIDGNPFNKIEIDKQDISIGRSISNTVYLEDPAVSQFHAKIEVKELKDGAFIYFLHDLNSTNHTFVNNKQVEIIPLTDQDLIVVGATNFKFVDEKNEKLAQTKAFKKSWIPGVFYLED